MLIERDLIMPMLFFMQIKVMVLISEILIGHDFIMPKPFIMQIKVKVLIYQLH